MINRLDMALGNGNRPYQYKVSIELPSAMASMMLDNTKVDALCKKVSVPDMQMEQVSMHIHGREVKVPFATNYSSETSIGFYLDDEFFMRHVLEFWMLSMDCYRTFNNPNYIGGLQPSPGVVDSLKNLGNSIINKLIDKGKSLLGSAISDVASYTGNETLKSGASMLDNFLNGISGSKLDAYKFGKILITPLNYNMNEICTYTLYNVYPINLSTINYANESIGTITEFDANFYYSHYTIESPTTLLGSLDKGAGALISKGTSWVNNL